MLVHVQDILPEFQNRLISDHNEIPKQSFKNKGRWYSKMQRKFPSIPWYTTITRMWTNYWVSKAYLQKNLTEDLYCEYGQIEDLNHIFLKCPINVLTNMDFNSKLRKCRNNHLLELLLIPF